MGGRLGGNEGVYGALARNGLAQGDPSGARAILQGVLAGEDAVFPHPHPRLGVTLTLLAEAKEALGDEAGAWSDRQDAAAEFAELPPDHPSVRRLATRGP